MLKLIAPGLSVLLLVGVAVDQSGREASPEGAAEYHARVLAAVQAIPYRLGDWVGVDTEIRQEALRILDANASLSRTYRNLSTGHTATLLLVHCSDSRSLLGHYPPVCYPSQGWTQLGATPHGIEREAESVAATEYAFAYESLANVAQLGVLHFTVLPDGRTAPDMGLLDQLARDKRSKFFGGASLQFIVDANLPDAMRDELYQMLYEAVSPWIETVQTGITS
jgi:hypothetical protein